MISEQEMINIVYNVLLIVAETFITDCVSKSLHYYCFSPASIILLSWHAFVDFDGHFLLSFMIQTHHDLSESSTVKFLNDFISISYVVADNDLIESSVSIESKVVSLVHTITTSVQDAFDCANLFGF